ncbi:MAG: ribosomal RNA small subunit methyltransferase A [Phototrophicales bacterium]|nr:MAG: ribosomal RNA small subunit methyltransferase A [Phototrophicales bacterium]
MSSPKQLLESLGITPKKSLGQNYLHDPQTLDKIVENAQLPPESTVLEIGAGLGALSVRLAPITKRLVLVETDTRVQPVLTEKLSNYSHVEIHWADILETDIDAIMGKAPYHVVANLPYYITSAIVRQLLEAQNPPQSMTITVQKEVAERMVATPNNMSLLSVSVQFFGEPRIVMRLNPGVFWPAPEVSSAVVYIDLRKRPLPSVENQEQFFKIVRAGFGQKRKQLKNALARGLGLSSDEVEAWLQNAGVQPTRRAETLTLSEWAKIYHTASLFNKS